MYEGVVVAESSDPLGDLLMYIHRYADVALFLGSILLCNLDIWFNDMYASATFLGPAAPALSRRYVHCCKCSKHKLIFISCNFSFLAEHGNQKPGRIWRIQIRSGMQGILCCGHERSPKINKTLATRERGGWSSCLGERQEERENIIEMHSKRLLERAGSLLAHGCCFVFNSSFRSFCHKLHPVLMCIVST